MPKYITRRIVYQPQARMEVVVEIQEQLEEELEYMMGKVFSEEALTHQVNTPTRLITITYKDTIIESYE